MAFSLVKLAYMACNSKAKAFYSDLNTMKIEVKPCCWDVLEYLKPNNGDRPVRFWSETAAFHGHTECLTFAIERGFPWTADVCHRAAAGGRLECLEYARSHGCPWDGRVCELAAANGHLDVLRYARENGCPLPGGASVEAAAAAAAGHLHVLEYLHEHGGVEGAATRLQRVGATSDADSAPAAAATV